MKNLNLINLINNATMNKEAFMNFLENYLGFKSHTDVHGHLSFLVKDANDAKQWFQMWDGGDDPIKSIFMTTIAFKEAKHAENKLSIHDFLAKCAVNLKEAMEILFQAATPKWAIKKLQDRISKGELTLKDVYIINQNSDWYNTLSKIVRSDISSLVACELKMAI